ncbi:hypothetical protein GYMLUDRAFT_541705 [Collybiopsis luxurians FD-317 M1]|nr:hypothetical protein GYMLUDRAFT_541705 [Collybiopsis luxurians FD-317 M1]
MFPQRPGYIRFPYPMLTLKSIQRSSHCNLPAFNCLTVSRTGSNATVLYLLAEPRFSPKTLQKYMRRPLFILWLKGDGNGKKIQAYLEKHGKFAFGQTKPFPYYFGQKNMQAVIPPLYLGPSANFPKYDDDGLETQPMFVRDDTLGIKADCVILGSMGGFSRVSTDEIWQSTAKWEEWWITDWPKGVKAH